MKIVKASETGEWTATTAVVIPYSDQDKDKLGPLLIKYGVEENSVLTEELSSPKAVFIRQHSSRKDLGVIFLVRCENGANPSLWKRQMAELTYSRMYAIPGHLILDLSLIEVQFAKSDVLPMATAMISGLQTGL